MIAIFFRTTTRKIIKKNTEQRVVFCVLNFNVIMNNIRLCRYLPKYFELTTYDGNYVHCAIMLYLALIPTRINCFTNVRPLFYLQRASYIICSTKHLPKLQSFGRNYKSVVRIGIVTLNNRRCCSMPAEGFL